MIDALPSSMAGAIGKSTDIAARTIVTPTADIPVQVNQSLAKHINDLYALIEKLQLQLDTKQDKA